MELRDTTISAAGTRHSQDHPSQGLLRLWDDALVDAASTPQNQAASVDASAVELPIPRPPEQPIPKSGTQWLWRSGGGVGNGHPCVLTAVVFYQSRSSQQSSTGSGTQAGAATVGHVPPDPLFLPSARVRPPGGTPPPAAGRARGLLPSPPSSPKNAWPVQPGRVESA